MQKKLFMLALILILLPTMACGFPSLSGFFGGDDETEEPAAAEVAAEATATPAPSPTPVPAESESVEPSPTPVEAPEEDSSNESDAQQSAAGTEADSMAESTTFAGTINLDDLSSYRVNFVLEFDGSTGGQPAQGHIEMALEATKDPAARHMSMTMEGSTVAELGGANEIEFYQVDNTIYLYNNAAGGQWISMSGGDGDAFTEGFFTPQEELDLPETARCDDAVETVNGIDTHHCTFTEEDIAGSDASFGTAKGDAWVAVDGNYIVKFQVEGEVFEGTGESNDMFDFGMVSYEYNLQSTNEDFTITVPEEALNAESFDFGLGDNESSGAGAASDLPIPDNAEDVFSVSGITSFFSNASVEEIANYYRQELTALGWSEASEQAVLSVDAGFLSFTKGTEKLALTMNREADGRVQVSLIPTGS